MKRVADEIGKRAGMAATIVSDAKVQKRFTVIATP